MMIALIALCLLAQLSGCNNSRTVYVKVPVVPLPASLTADTPQPEIPDNLTWGQSLDLNVSLLSALGQCNRDKADIRQAERKTSLAIAGLFNAYRTRKPSRVFQS
jgi:hypothetical protein